MEKITDEITHVSVLGWYLIQRPETDDDGNLTSYLRDGSGVAEEVGDNLEGQICEWLVNCYEYRPEGLELLEAHTEDARLALARAKDRLR